MALKCLLLFFGFGSLATQVAHAKDLNAGYQSLFNVSVYLDNKFQISYEFQITTDGLLCPLRPSGPGKTYQYFSTIPSNRGCLDVSKIGPGKVVSGEFLSANDPNSVDSDGVKELPGKSFKVTANGISYQHTLVTAGYTLNVAESPGDVAPISEIDTSLSLVGKSYAREARMLVWVVGKYDLDIRFKKENNGVWTVSHLSEDKILFNRFTKVDVYLDSPNKVGAGFNRIFRVKGTEDKPLQIVAKPEKIFYRP